MVAAATAVGRRDGMTDMYQLEYRCRRCGEICTGEDDEKTFYASNAMAAAIADVAIREGSLDVNRYDFHECEDGGMGLADLIGARKEGE